MTALFTDALTWYCSTSTLPPLLSSDTTTPTLNVCYEELIVRDDLLLELWVGIACYTVYAWWRRRFASPSDSVQQPAAVQAVDRWHPVQYAIALVWLSLAIIPVVTLITVTVQDSAGSDVVTVPPFIYFSQLLHFMTFALVCVMYAHTASTQSNTSVTSYVTYLYPFCWLLPNAVTIGSTIIRDEWDVLSITTLVTASLLTLQCVLTSIGGTIDTQHAAVNDEICAFLNSDVSLISRLTYSWISPVFAAAQNVSDTQKFETDVLPALTGELKTDAVADKFETAWKQYIEHNSSNSKHASSKSGIAPAKLSLLWLILRCYGREYLLLGLIRFANDLLSFVGPIFLNLLVTFIDTYNHTDSNAYYGYLYVTAMTANTLILALLSTQFNYRLAQIDLKIQNALSTSIYKKLMTISSTSLGESSHGNIQNLLSTDIHRIIDLLPSIHSLWSLPLQIVVACILLWTQVGWALLAGVAVIVALIPINAFLTAWIQRVTQRLMESKDQRVDLISEVIRQIKVVKFLAYERLIEARVKQYRQKEVKYLTQWQYIDAGFVWMWACSSVLISLATFTTYTWWMQQTLTAAKVFTSIALFNTLVTPINALPWVVNGIVEARISLKRVSKFLNAADKPTYGRASPSVDASIVIKLRGTFRNSPPTSLDDAEQEKSSSEHQPFALQDVNVSIKRGEHVGVTGIVGSGKSTLLRAMLGEVPAAEGSDPLVVCRGRVGYVSQSGAWLVSGTVRHNITIGSDEFDSERYKQVISACALQPDFNQLAASDQTEVSANTLSGGQRVRLSLARALYSNCDVYLLDDPIAALDVNVSHHIVKHVLNGPLMANKTCVLVTHHTHALQGFDRVLKLDNGIIQEAESVDYSQDTNDTNSHSSSTGKPEDITQHQQATGAANNGHSTNGNGSVNGPHESPPLGGQHQPTETTTQPDGKLIADEDRQYGTIRLRILTNYLALIGVVFCVITFCSISAQQATRNATDFWLSYWSEQRATADQTNYYLTIFATIALSNSVAALARAFSYAYSVLRACTNLFDKLYHHTLYLPLSFYETRGAGQIINRLSGDIEVVDDQLPFIANILLAHSFRLMGTVVVLLTVAPPILLLLIPLAFVYRSIAGTYRAASREIRRLDQINHSPVYNILAESLAGIETIRAGRLEGTLIKSYTTALDNSLRVDFSSTVISLWLTIRLQLIGACVLAAIGFLTISTITVPTLHIDGIVNKQLLGLALAWCLPLTDLLNDLIGTFTDTEKELISVERCVEYTTAQTEDQLYESTQVTTRSRQSSTTKSPRSRPGSTTSTPLNKLRALIRKNSLSQTNSNGVTAATDSLYEPLLFSSNHHHHRESSASIMDFTPAASLAFRNVSLRYRDGLPLALDQVTFNIRPGEHLAIVGRSGAGKSSILEALFRLRPLTEGCIKLNGIDTTSMDRYELRSSIAIITQVPVLFSNITIRQNLDPYEKYTNEAIWQTLERCHIADRIKQLEAGLDTTSTSTSFLSVGEQQLLCLCRVLLQKSSLVCLDEATSAVDATTDALITEIVTNLKCTVLIIAHRLQTIQHVDRVIVMDNATVVEDGTPSELEQRADSRFCQLVRQSQSNQII